MLGLISSFHCVGMCGPLALSLPVQHLGNARKAGAVLLYHSGRIMVYAGFGLVFGLAGRRIYLAGFQHWFSILLGAAMLALLLQNYMCKKSLQPLFLQRYYRLIQRSIARLWQAPSKIDFLLLGMTNGLLPCGMVYLAVAGALSTSQVVHSVVFMAAFGAGTLPLLAALSYVGMLANVSLRNRIKKMMPFFIAAMGIVLILRGLNLGIPFISPVLASPRPESISCH